MTIPVKGTFAFDWEAQSDYPSWGPDQFKQNLNARDEELKDALNAVANMLNSTAAGVGGADNIGATAPTGLIGVTVQAILSALKTAIDTQKTVIDTHSANTTTAHGINLFAKKDGGTLTNSIISGLLNSSYAKKSDGNGVQLFRDNCMLVLFSVDAGAPIHYLVAIGYKTAAGNPIMNVVSAMTLTIGPANVVGTQVVYGGTAANIISYGLSIPI